MHSHPFSSFRLPGFAAIVAMAWWALATTAHAGAVYECRGHDGDVAFQDHPCIGARHESVVELAPAPQAASSPQYALPHAEHPTKTMRATRTQQARSDRDQTSYECKAADGETFYRHGACPKQIDAKAGAAATSSRKRVAGAGSLAVSATPLARGDACKKIAASGSAGRAGHERDESVSTYERNLGRDPCRRF